jgi:DNA-binding transcriptional MerR regulator
MLILRGKRIGLSLLEIRELFDLYDAASNDEPQLREFIRILSRKEQQLQEQLDDIRGDGRNQPDPQPVREGTGQTGIINTVAGQASLSGRNTQMQQQESIVIVGMARTAMGGFQGMFASQTASQLGAAAIAPQRGLVWLPRMSTR